METSVDRYLDDGRGRLFSVVLRSRTTEMHSVLTALTEEQRAEVQRVLAKAAADIAEIATPVAEAQPRSG